MMNILSKASTIFSRFKCNKLKKHDWVFLGGEWIVPKKYAVTHRMCKFCMLQQDIGQDHTLGIRDLLKEIPYQKCPDCEPKRTTNAVPVTEIEPEEKHEQHALSEFHI